MNKSKNELIEEFIRESNHIEGEYSQDAFEDAMKAFLYLKGHESINQVTLLIAHRTLMERRKLENKYKGAYRDIPVYIGGIEALNHYKIRESMLPLLKRISKSTLSAKIKQMHIEFEKIHPFVDGNGRIGRMLMLWQMLRGDRPITVIHAGQEQQEYYQWFKE